MSVCMYVCMLCVCVQDDNFESLHLDTHVRLPKMQFEIVCQEGHRVKVTAVKQQTTWVIRLWLKGNISLLCPESTGLLEADPGLIRP